MLNNHPEAIALILPAGFLTAAFPNLRSHDLLNAKLVEKLWQRITNKPAIWQNLINHYYPYLPPQNQNTYQTEPKEMFITEFKRIYAFFKNHYAKHLTIKKLLPASLCGDIEKIEKSEISDPAKEQLYIFSAANGHLLGLNKLNVAVKSYAFLLAAQNGYSPACQMILTQADKQISAEHKGLALGIAAQNGYLDAVQTLLTLAGKQILPKHKARALHWAADYDYFEVVLFMLTQTGKQNWAVNKGLALQWAALRDYPELVQTLLIQSGQEISAKYKGLALRTAAQKQHFNVVQSLLTLAGPEISAWHKCHALLNAVRKSHLDMESFLSERIGHEPLFFAVMAAIKLVRICKFYTWQIATLVKNTLASKELFSPMTKPPKMQPFQFPPTTIQEMPKNTAGRKEESTTNGMNVTRDETVKIKRIKLR